MMLEHVELRMAITDDLFALQQVGDELFDYTIKIERAKEFLNDARHHLVLAFYQNKLIGMASAINYVHPDKNPSLFINEVSVLHEFQNQKIGRSLIEYLVEFGKSLGCQEAWTLTEKSNIAAHKAYLAAGGVEAGDSVVMFDFPTNIST